MTYHHVHQILLLIWCYQSHSISNTICTDSDTKTVYSECSGVSSERWQVFVSDSTACTPPPPVKVAACDKTCRSGEILRNFTDCVPCGKGTYSPGNMVVYPWLDPGINQGISFLSSKIKLIDKSCADIWIDSDTVVLPADQCYNVITVSFKLVKPGSLTLHYYYPDDRVDLVFNLKTSNSKTCDVGVTIESQQGEQSFHWQTAKFDVPTKGQHLLEIKSTAFFNLEPESLASVPLESPRIGKFAVTGTDPYTACSSCPSGFISPREGLSECAPCPQNTSTRKDDKTQCIPCPPGQYSEPPLSPGGVSSTHSGVNNGQQLECVPQVDCPESQFVPVVGPCRKGVSRLSWKEVVTNKCSNTLPTEDKPCQKCQPGSEKVGGNCEFCADGTHNSGGSDMCLPCSPNTISLKGLYYVWWDRIPDQWQVRCPDCWHPAGRFLLGKTKNYQPISINFGAVEYSSNVITSNVVGLFTVQFKLVCPASCSFLIIKEHRVSDVKMREVVESYDKSVGDSVPEIARVNVLQTSSLDTESPADNQEFSLQLSGDGAFVHLFAVNFTNTRKGGSSYCFPCTGAGCKECVLGMVYEKRTCQNCDDEEGRCVKCPENTYHVISGSVLDSDYNSRCLRCPPGTLAQPGSTSCYTPCSLVLPSSNNSYDVSILSDAIVYDQPNSFPDQFGNRFHYRYRMKLCSADGNLPKVDCINDNVRGAQICQLNVLTKTNGSETVSNPTVKGNVVSRISEATHSGMGVVVQFTTSSIVPECDRITTNITLLCNRDHTGLMRMQENSVCRLSFVYDGPFGCRLCKDSDYNSIISSCEEGIKNVTYIKREGVVCLGGVPLPPLSTEECTPFHESLSDSIRRFKLYIGLGVILFAILILGLCLLGWYSSNLKHKLDGYAQLSYANDDKYSGVRGGPNNNFVFAESDSDDNEGSEDTLVYTRSGVGAVVGGRRKGRSPGDIISDKLHQLHGRLVPGRERNVGQEDIMQLTSNFEI